MLPRHLFFLAVFATILTSTGFVFVLTAQAQLRETLDISVSPDTPVADAETTITINSSYFDIGASQFAWSLNGAPGETGPGVRSFTFKMGPIGKSTIVNVRIIPPAGDTINRTLTFRPGGVVLLWEAKTYVPPFYRGKSLYTPGSDIEVLALTTIYDSSGALIAPGDLNFKWKIDETAYADRSGLGRNTLDLTGNFLGGPSRISVDVLKRDGSKAGAGFVQIDDADPLVLFYKKDPLRGTLYSKALINQVALDETETTIVAEPYYMSGDNRNQSQFTYEWTLNDTPITPQGVDPAVITLRQKTTQTGSATLGFTIHNTDGSKLL